MIFGLHPVPTAILWLCLWYQPGVGEIQILLIITPWQDRMIPCCVLVDNGDRSICEIRL